MIFNIECYYDEYQQVECLYAEFQYFKCCYADYQYATCYYSKCLYVCLVSFCKLSFIMHYPCHFTECWVLLCMLCVVILSIYAENGYVCIVHYAECLYVCWVSFYRMCMLSVILLSVYAECHFTERVCWVSFYRVCMLVIVM